MSSTPTRSRYRNDPVEQSQFRTNHQSNCSNGRNYNYEGQQSWEVQLVDDYQSKLALEQSQQMERSRQSRMTHQQGIVHNYTDLTNVNTNNMQVNERIDTPYVDQDMSEFSFRNSLMNTNIHSTQHDSLRGFELEQNRSVFSMIIEEDYPNNPLDFDLSPTRYPNPCISMKGSRKRRSSGPVRFAEEALLYSCSNHTYDDIPGMWYNRDKLKEFKDDRNEIVRVLRKNHFNIPYVEKTFADKYCLRGYEPYFSVEGNREIRRNRKIVLRTVLNEQSRQVSSTSTALEKGVIFDHDVIAKACTEVSKSALDCAKALGEQDANAIQFEYSGKDRTAIARAREKGTIWKYLSNLSIQEVLEEYYKLEMEYYKYEQQQLEEQQLLFNPHQANGNGSDDYLQMNQEEFVDYQRYQNQGQEQQQFSREHQSAFECQQAKLLAFQQQQDGDQRFGLEQHHLAWYEEQEKLFYSQQQQINNSNFNSTATAYQIQQAEHEQILRVQEMEREEQRRQDQIRIMVEEQQKIMSQLRSTNIRTNSYNDTYSRNTSGNGDWSEIMLCDDEELTLKLVEQLQMNHEYHPGNTNQ